jgi:hypothetical protein
MVQMFRWFSAEAARASRRSEQFRLLMDAWEFFSGHPGAGWDAKPQAWNSCPINGPFTFGDNMVLVSSVANGAVKRASTVLSGVLNKLEISTSKNDVAPSDIGPNSFTGKVFGSGSPWDLAARDPTLIVLLIGPNSMQGLYSAEEPPQALT